MDLLSPARFFHNQQRRAANGDEREAEDTEQCRGGDTAGLGQNIDITRDLLVVVAG